MAQIPIFPLQLIAFPQERVPLHIFEPRYVRLTHHCRDTGEPFGLVPVFEGKISPYGTAMYLDRITETYQDGRMDILTQGGYVFKVEDLHPEESGEACHEASIIPIEDNPAAGSAKQEEVLNYYRLFHKVLGTEQAAEAKLPEDAALLSFALGHTSGLDFQQQIKLLSLPSEEARLDMLLTHFQDVLPVAEGITLTKSKLIQNGHYRLAKGEDFDLNL